MTDFSGQTIHGYYIHEQVAQGGQTTVYRAYDPRHERDVAARVVKPELMGDEEMQQRFQMEAAIVFRLKHPYIVPLYDYWNDESGVWLVMQWMTGGSLQMALKRDGVWSLERAAQMLDEVCAALDFAHQKNIIHRDLKPGNILFDDAGTAFVHDFGIAKHTTGKTKLTKPGVMIGSPAYISPEQAQRFDITPRTDIYILGLTLYETIAGQHPFAGTPGKINLVLRQIRDPLPDIQTIQPHIPAAVNTVLQTATAKNPEDRYPTASALAQAFRDAVGG